MDNISKSMALIKCCLLYHYNQWYYEICHLREKIVAYSLQQRTHTPPLENRCQSVV